MSRITQNMLKIILILAGGILFIYGGIITIQSQQKFVTNHTFSMMSYWENLYGSNFMIGIVILAISSILLGFGLFRKRTVNCHTQHKCTNRHYTMTNV